MPFVIDLTEDSWLLTLLTPPRPGRPPIPADIAEQVRVGVAVRVPGTVHRMLAGLIPDPRQAANETAARWVGWTRWRLERQVEVTATDGPWKLEFDGIDTVATVFWDDIEIARTRNMHRRYSFPVAASPGRHLLAVEFEAPELEALAAEERIGQLPNDYGRPFNALRKTASNFGWDWGPDFPSAGLWRAVRLVNQGRGRLGDVFVETNREGAGWVARIRTNVTADEAFTVRAQLCGEQQRGEVAPTGEARLEIRVPDPALWWPRTHGDPVLHDLTVELLGADGTVVDFARRRVGFREVDLEQIRDDRGTSFALSVNDVPLFVRGVNWIPDSCFPGEQTDVAARLLDAAAANCNLVRVWGGGTYESDEFYDLTDELGLLVWQDFLFACSCYSEDPELAEEVAAEARDNIFRLQYRPSLALWCGNNENLWAFEEWGWAEEVGDRAWGAGYYYDLLPQLVGELDPGRAYVPGSPHSLDGAPANDDRSGCSHLWEVWNELDHEHYLDREPRFASEFGYQGPPDWRTMAECVGEEQMRPDDPVLMSHQKAEGGHLKLDRGMSNRGGVPWDPATWWWRGQHIQADAVRTGVLHTRSLMPHCMGSIYWQLNDCWPVISWSVVDDAGRRKPAWYALRSAYADRVVGLLGEPEPRLVIVNDTDQDWATTVIVESAAVGATAIRSIEVAVEVPARTSQRLAVDLSGLFPQSVLRARASDGVTGPPWLSKALWHSAGTARYSMEPRRVDGGWELHIAAETVLVDACVRTENLDESTEADQLLTLFPGETGVLHVRGAEDATPEEFSLRHWLSVGSGQTGAH